MRCKIQYIVKELALAKKIEAALCSPIFATLLNQSTFATCRFYIIPNVPTLVEMLDCINRKEEKP